MRYDNADMCECGKRFGEHFSGNNSCPVRFFRPKPNPWHPASQPPSDARSVLTFVPELVGDMGNHDTGMRVGWFVNSTQLIWVIEGPDRGLAPTLWRELPPPPKGGTV